MRRQQRKRESVPVTIVTCHSCCLHCGAEERSDAASLSLLLSVINHVFAVREWTCGVEHVKSVNCVRHCMKVGPVHNYNPDNNPHFYQNASVIWLCLIFLQFKQSTVFCDLITQRRTMYPITLPSLIGLYNTEFEPSAFIGSSRPESWWSSNIKRLSQQDRTQQRWSSAHCVSFFLLPLFPS